MININNINKNINNNINNKKRTLSMIDNELDNIIIMNDGYGNISLNDKPVYIQNISELNNTENNHINCYDIGENSSEELFNLIDSADIIFWNGSLGVIEHEIYKLGSIRIAKYLEKRTDKKIIIGGGETASLFKSNLEHIYISTGGGALLEYLENKILYNKLLPGLDIFS
jgi:3-phosphoglycerate kinase